MNTFDIIVIIALAVIIIFGLILGLSKGGRFFLTLYGSVSISTFIMIPAMSFINQQKWFVDLSKVFLGYNWLSIITYFILLAISTAVLHFILHFVLKFISLTVKDEKFTSHLGGMMLGIMNGALLVLAVLLICDFMNGKIETETLTNVYNSFFYTFLKPALTFINGGN